MDYQTEEEKLEELKRRSRQGDFTALAQRISQTDHIGSPTHHEEPEMTYDETIKYSLKDYLDTIYREEE